jgi:hypothetical protein
MEFYEHDELSEQLDNWFGPSMECLQALCRTAAFARVELCDDSDQRAAFACYRKWDRPGEPFSNGAPELPTVMHYRNYGFNFRSDADDYVLCWFRAPGQRPTIDTVFPEAGGFGVKPIQVRRLDENLWAAAFKLPPGLAHGWHAVRLRTEGGPWSESRRIAVDMPTQATAVHIEGMADGRTWRPGEVTSGFVSVWVTGLTDVADRGNVRIMIDGRAQPTLFISEVDAKGMRQVNASLRPAVQHGTHEVRVEFGGVRSNTVAVEVRAT